jgi:hypothetical protein
MTAGDRVRTALLPVILLGMTGCMLSAKPVGDLGYTPVQGLKNLEGCYQNNGDDVQGSNPGKLVFLIWPGREDLYLADSVLVRAVSKSQLEAQAYKGDVVLSSSSFVFREGLFVS